MSGATAEDVRDGGEGAGGAGGSGEDGGGGEGGGSRRGGGLGCGVVGLSIGIDPSYRESDAMASFVARPGDWPARSTARLQPSGWAARSAKLLAALLMSQRLMCDVDMVEEQQ